MTANRQCEGLVSVACELGVNRVFVLSGIVEPDVRVIILLRSRPAMPPRGGFLAGSPNVTMWISVEIL